MQMYIYFRSTEALKKAGSPGGEDELWYQLRCIADASKNDTFGTWGFRRNEAFLVEKTIFFDEMMELIAEDRLYGIGHDEVERVERALKEMRGWLIAHYEAVEQKVSEPVPYRPRTLIVDPSPGVSFSRPM